MIYNGNDPGVHRIRIELLADKNPASKGTVFRILGLIAAGREAR